MDAWEARIRGMCNVEGGPGQYLNLFRDLKPGDEVLLFKGFGDPRAEKDKTVVIAAVVDCSALATDGTKINCHHRFEKTGEHYPNPELSPKARQILESMGLD